MDNIDYSKTVTTKHLSKEVRPDEDLPQAILDLINSQPIFISKYFENNLGLKTFNIRCISKSI